MPSASTPHADAPGAPTAGLSPAELKSLYRALVFPRQIEEKMLILLRQGKLSKWFAGIGQEVAEARVP